MRHLEGTTTSTMQIQKHKPPKFPNAMIFYALILPFQLLLLQPPMCIEHGRPPKHTASTLNNFAASSAMEIFLDKPSSHPTAIEDPQPRSGQVRPARQIGEPFQGADAKCIHSIWYICRKFSPVVVCTAKFDEQLAVAILAQEGFWLKSCPRRTEEYKTHRWSKEFFKIFTQQRMSGCSFLRYWGMRQVDTSCLQHLSMTHAIIR